MTGEAGTPSPSAAAWPTPKPMPMADSATTPAHAPPATRPRGAATNGDVDPEDPADRAAVDGTALDPDDVRGAGRGLGRTGRAVGRRGSRVAEAVALCMVRFSPGGVTVRPERPAASATSGGCGPRMLDADRLFDEHVCGAEAPRVERVF